MARHNNEENINNSKLIINRINRINKDDNPFSDLELSFVRRVINAMIIDIEAGHKQIEELEKVIELSRCLPNGRKYSDIEKENNIWKHENRSINKRIEVLEKQVNESYDCIENLNKKIEKIISEEKQCQK